MQLPLHGEERVITRIASAEFNGQNRQAICIRFLHGAAVNEYRWYMFFSARLARLFKISTPKTALYPSSTMISLDFVVIVIRKFPSTLFRCFNLFHFFYKLFFILPRGELSKYKQQQLLLFLVLVLQIYLYSNKEQLIATRKISTAGGAHELRKWFANNSF